MLPPDGTWRRLGEFQLSVKWINIRRRKIGLNPFPTDQLLVVMHSICKTTRQFYWIDRLLRVQCYRDLPSLRRKLLPGLKEKNFHERKDTFAVVIATKITFELIYTVFRI